MSNGTTTLTPSVRDFDPNETLRQIGTLNVLSISGGRASLVAEGLMLPVGNGYSVRITLAADDTYTVERVFTRGGRHWIKGRREGVYCDEIGDAAYYASCFRSYDETEWVTK